MNSLYFRAIIRVRNRHLILRKGPMEFPQLLTFAVQNNASDIHIQAGLAPGLRIGGILRFTNQPPLTHEAVRDFISSIAPPRFRENLEDRLLAGLDFSYAMTGVSRFRCSAYQQ